MINRIIIRGYRVFTALDMSPQRGLNIIVGSNEAGKSTLLEAIGMALTGRINGRWLEEQLDPFWINQDLVGDFFAKVKDGGNPAPPEITIELFLDPQGDVHEHRGVHNSLGEDAPGLAIKIRPSDEFAEEMAAYLKEVDRPDLIPVEYYEVVWQDFAGTILRRRPKGLGVSFIDSRTIRSSGGLDYHTREMLEGFVEPKERAATSVALRKAHDQISRTTLAAANERIQEQGVSLLDNGLQLQMDQSPRALWESGVVPHIDQVPFSLTGQGQQASIKIALAMHRSAASTSYVLIEEPENHLSHTTLRRLVKRIEVLAGERQVFITTHSSYVLNRLGLDKLHLLHQGTMTNTGAIGDETVRYFQRLSGFDSLRIVLADKLVLVEGPSDEMVFERAFMQKHNEAPLDRGIDIVSTFGIALSRPLELCSALGRHAAALRDNDGKAILHWTQRFEAFLENGKREIFVGDPEQGSTLEPQLVAVNDDKALREVLVVKREEVTPCEWMKQNKTEAALRLLEAPDSFVLQVPDYITRAIEFIE